MSESESESSGVIPTPPPLKKPKIKCYFNQQWVQNFKGIGKSSKG